jgi:hypothetical protein
MTFRAPRFARSVAAWRPAYKALAVGGITILAWDVFCPPGETISDGVGALKSAQPVAVVTVTAVTAAHLLDWLPPAVDPFRWLFRVLRGAL